MTELERLEAQVGKDRAALERSFDALAETFSPDRIASDFNDTVKGYGGELGSQVMSVARQNPAATALIGAGLLLLMSRGDRRDGKQPARPSPVDPMDAMEGFDARVEKADAAMRSEMSGTLTSPSALRLRAALDRGIGKLPPDARARVLKARKAALDAQERVEAAARKATGRAKQTHQRHPMITGAIAFGIGAIAAALLPGTRREDALLGARRDALMTEAQRVMSEELNALRSKAEQAVSDFAEQTAAE